MPIRAKLVIVVFVFAILPMFLLWARWQATAVGTIERMLQQDADSHAREISANLDRQLKEHQAQLIELAKQAVLQSYARALGQNSNAVPDGELRVTLSAFLLAHQQQFLSFAAFNRDSAMLFKIEARPGTSGVLQPFFIDKGFAEEDSLDATAALTSGDNFISEIATSSSNPFLWVVVPLRNEANELTGALAGKLSVNELLTAAVGPRSQPITDLKTPARQLWRETLVLSPSGTVLYAADVTKQGSSYTEAFAKFQRPFAALLRGEAQDRSWNDWLLHHRARVATPKLAIIALEQYDQAISGLEYDAMIMFLLTLVLAVVATLTLYYLISNITQSIRRVTVGAQSIASGDLNHQINVKTNDETRVLAHAFNRMAAKLREMIKKEGEQKQFESFARLSAVLTHDLKNQILSLSLLVSNMEKKFNREGFREDAMRTLSDTVDNLQNLVAKLSDPRTPTKRVRERSNVTHLVERALQRTAQQAAGQYQVTAKLTPNVTAMVDGKAVERVIENLIINALEAMPNGGQLFVLTNVENQNAIISVTDTGKGMTEEFKRTRLFQPFATTKKKGIGLGLYSCREIIEQHGGRIEVTSEVNVGTEFRVVLPLVSADNEVMALAIGTR
ncbi:MAG: HAMP domain-containing protein [Acidobacteria bacterium]|nr:HAMP domain-containing protein [Acidobacteriota bacterium]